jgi:hypothetical protein
MAGTVNQAQVDARTVLQGEPVERIERIGGRAGREERRAIGRRLRIVDGFARLCRSRPAR